MTDGDALLKAIIAHPDEDVPRLVYADWLDENGEPGRAEFIRAQCWLWANPSCGSCTGTEWMHGKPCAECDRREATRGHVAVSLFGGGRWRDWAGPAVALVPAGARWDDHIEFARGFVERVTCSAADWLREGDAIRAAHPVTAVRLTTLPSVGQIQKAGGFTFDGTDWPPSRFLVRRWPGVTFELPAPAHATA